MTVYLHKQSFFCRMQKFFLEVLIKNMYIQPIQTNKYKTNNITFNKWRREVLVEHSKKIQHRNDTWFFRDSEFWAKLNHYLVQKYKDTPKVNVYCYGCSDGSEPLTFLMQMLSIHKDDAYKFLPIIAKDYDPVAINKACTNNQYSLIKNEIEDIDYYTDGNFKTLFEQTDNGYYTIKSEIKNNIKFSVKNLLNDYKNIEPKNSVILARNFWPYIDLKSDRQKLLNNLAKHIDKTSMLVIGDYDIFGTGGEFEYQLSKAGFMRTKSKYIYELR